MVMIRIRSWETYYVYKNLPKDRRTWMCVCVCVWFRMCPWWVWGPHHFFTPLIFSLSSLHFFCNLTSHAPSSPLPSKLLSPSLVSPPSASLSLTGCQEELNNMTFNHDGNMNSPAARLFFHVLADLFSLPAPVFLLEMIISAPGD